MKRALEPKPLLVAAGIGAVLLFLLSKQRPQALVAGAVFGAAIQFGVRVAGVS